METELKPAYNPQKLWLSRLSQEEKAHRNFRDRAEEVQEVYHPDSGDDGYVPLLWSVVSVEHAGVYSNQPIPDVRPRNEAQNPLYQDVSTIIRRGLDYCVDHPSFDEAMHRSIDDFLAMALGVARVKIDSVINRETTRVPIFGVVPTLQGPQEVQVGDREEINETIGDQTIRWEYVPWARFGWEPCNNWDHCTWIYFRHRMTNAQARKRFGKTVKASRDEKDTGDINSWKAQTIDIYEIWDKTNGEVLFIAKGEDEPLQIHEDPLELLDFFPVPKPMMTNLPSDELIPKPDYDYIEHYDRELNRLQEKRADLIEGIKACGAYDLGMPELGEILELNDGEMKGINGLMSRMVQAGGPDRILWFLPIIEKVQALEETVKQISFIKAQVDEILGISDIVRGVTAASETATAQEIKGRWVGVRLTRKRETVIYTVKEMMRIMAQLLVSHITPENLSRMTQMQITEEMMQILQDDMMMEFLIDIETDSTIAKDEFRERETHQEMLNGVAQFAQAVLPMVQQAAMPADLAAAILRTAMKPYAKFDRGLEQALGSMQTSQQQLEQMNQQVQQTGQQLQQAQMQLQQWQMIAQQLQQQATEAKAAKERADAELKAAQAANTRAKTLEIMSDVDLEPVKTLATINEVKARTENLRGNGSGG